MMKRCMGCMELYKDDVFICPHCGYEENTLPEEAFHLTPGTVIGKRYQIGKVLGFGGFGVTYIGFDLLLEKKIAVKEYLPSEFATRIPSQTYVSVYSDEKTEQFEQGMTKFVEEAKKLAKFNETAEIVNVYDCLMENNTAYIIMEYLEGESLKQYLEKKKKLSVKEAEGIILPILRSLHSVHEAGLIHRDIAPDNIFLTDDGRVKLLDFGAARYASATHSRSLSVIYKPGYAPEEQYQSRGNQGPWTDVYALAATMYKMITGITPDTSIERRAKDSLKPPSKLGVDITKNQETALLNALNIQVKNRTQSTKQFLEEWESKGTVTRLIEVFTKADVGKLTQKAKIAILSSIVAVGVIVAVVLGMGGIERITAGINIQSGKTRVPVVVNETMDTAQEKALDAGLQLEVTGREYSAEIKKDLVLNQAEAGGSLVELGSKLGVMVSGGVRQIFMPEISGKLQSDAKEILENNGFVVVVEEVFSEVIPPGNIAKANVLTGTQCDEGTTVIIYVSKGIDPSTVVETEKKYVVENYVGKTVEEVRSVLAGTGVYLDDGNKEYSDTVPAGIIISQSTPVGTELEMGSSVLVIVSLGKQFIRIEDDLTAIDIATAELKIQSMLMAQGISIDELNLEVVDEEYHPSYKAGLIISLSDAEGNPVSVGTQLEKGSVLNLVISKGPEPTATLTPDPTATNTPKPTATNTPKPTATNTPKPTATNTPKPTATNTPKPTPTNTPKPTATNTPKPTPTNTPKPTPTNTPKPSSTPTPIPHVHSYWNAGVINATCTSEGRETYLCVCGDSWISNIPATGHSEVIISGKDATCTVAGLTDGKKCKDCGTVTVAQQTIAAKGHSEVTVSGKDATCTAAGLTDGKKCKDCGTVTVAQQTIATKGHAYSNDTDLACNNCGYVRGYWSEWKDNGISAVSETSTRQVKQEAVSVTVNKYQYKRCVWYNSSGTFCSSQLPPNGYSQGTVKEGSKKYRWDYSDFYSSPIECVWKQYSGYDEAITTYNCDDTIYYTEIVEENITSETHYFYRDVIYY